MLFLTFLDDFKTFNIPDDVISRFFSIIKIMMNKNELHYHSFNHLESIFEFINKHKIETNILDRISLYFHDVVYVPQYHNNEDASANFCQSLLDPYLQPYQISFITNAIKTTKLHLEKKINKNFELILDLDLSGFATPYEIYKNNTKLLEKEFFFVKDFKEKRKSFLMNLIKKPIYRSKQFKQFEPIAQNNIQKDIENL